MNLILRTIATAIAVWVASLLLPGISVQTQGSQAAAIGTFILIAAIIGLVNTIVKPLAQALSGCLILLTLGLFLLVVNAAMLILSSWICAQLGIGFAVDGWGTALIGSIIISVVSGLINGVTGANDKSSQ
ncbi:phage holin family protein [Propionimicrobium sp. PCR01-08-3]|uniref:phage holin family protein n=1 Tax=Propionimicrobium sp. PCR01-08-3 TaxID=3052086 RepID=UPI00255C6157|nr:phage holin family protein [Propionimicrobium sp. PCR01-08-3]WIY82673.1 phage holin family protein [Propionimicrobium sp. PCR01-08-3]